MKGDNNNTKHQPRPCMAAHNADERDKTRSPRADLNGEAVQAAILEAFCYG